MMIDQIPENLLKLIKDGESSTVEFKTAKKNLPIVYLKLFVQC